MTLGSLRGSALAVIMAMAAWSAGCATAPPPLVDPAFATGAYVPARIAVLPPDVFVVLDQVGDNDPARSAAVGQAVSGETVRVVEQALRARGYDVDLSARWDGIVAGDGSVLVSRDELGWLANGVLQFGNSGAGADPAAGPGYVAPELAAKVGWATQSDALLYVNIKGVTTTSGKRAASILAGVFIVVIVAAIVLALVANSKGGGGSGGPGVGGGGFRGQSVARAPSGGGFRGVPPAGGAAARMPSGGFHGAPTSGGAAAAMPSGSAMARPPGAFSAPSGGAATSGGWRGGGAAQGGGGGGWRGGGGPPRGPGARVYDGRPHVGVGVGVVIPLDGPVYTHDGDVQHEDEMFAGDELYVSMTLVSTNDGRVLWHARQELDLDAQDPRDIDRMVQSFIDMGTLPPRGGWQRPAATTKK
ncbi:MAG TPA: hypothetical protein VGK52_03955 [Polyangia bacterium]